MFNAYQNALRRLNSPKGTNSPTPALAKISRSPLHLTDCLVETDPGRTGFCDVPELVTFAADFRHGLISSFWRLPVMTTYGFPL